MQDNELVNISEEEMEKRGVIIAKLLYCKKSSHEGEYKTEWGSKTPKGLYLTILGVMEGKLI
jgi:hypothetical protein